MTASAHRIRSAALVPAFLAVMLVSGCAHTDATASSAPDTPSHAAVSTPTSSSTAASSPTPTAATPAAATPAVAAPAAGGSTSPYAQMTAAQIAAHIDALPSDPAAGAACMRNSGMSDTSKFAGTFFLSIDDAEAIRTVFPDPSSGAQKLIAGGMSPAKLLEQELSPLEMLKQQGKSQVAVCMNKLGPDAWTAMPELRPYTKEIVVYDELAGIVALGQY